VALVNTPTAKLDFTFVDGSGSLGHSLIHVPYATLAAAAITAADAISAAMALLTDAVVTGYSLTYTKFDDAPGTPAAASRVEKVPRFRRFPVFGSFFREYRRYSPLLNFLIMFWIRLPVRLGEVPPRDLDIDLLLVVEVSIERAD